MTLLLTGLTGGGDLVRGLVLLTGCVIGAACWPRRWPDALGVAVGPTCGPRRLASDDDGIDVRSGSESAGLIRDDGPTRLADAAPEIVTTIIILSITERGFDNDGHKQRWPHDGQWRPHQQWPQKNNSHSNEGHKKWRRQQWRPQKMTATAMKATKNDGHKPWQCPLRAILSLSKKDLTESLSVARLLSKQCTMQHPD